jgi:predicted nucleotidyltransferase
MIPGLLNQVAASLDSAGVRYALVGAGALAAHGVARSTFDLDLFTTDAAALNSATWAKLSADSGVHVDIRRGDADDPLLGVVRLAAAGERDIDVVVGRMPWQTDAVTRARQVEIAGLTLPVVGSADLVLLKLYAGGSQDFWDIEQLLARDDRQSLVREVETRLGLLPRECGRAWARIVGGR